MWFFGLVVVLLIGAVAVVASGRWGAMSTAYDDRPDLSVPARQTLTADDIEATRFGVGLRGYRMDEVDSLLERVAREVAGADAVKDEELSFLLMYLREYAGADGTLPLDFDALVRETFGELLTANR